MAVIVLAACAGASAATLSSTLEGDSAVAFQFPRQGLDAPAFVALRAAGDVFDRPVRLTPHGAGSPDVAVAPGGAAVAAWNDAGDGAIRASFREPGGAWGEAVTLAKHGEGPQAEIDSHGEALVVWDRPHGVMASAVRPSGGQFQAQGDLPGEGSLAALAMDGAGNAIVLSLLHGSASFSSVQSSFRPAGGVFGAPQLVATAGASYGVGLAMNAAGDAIAVYPTEEGGLAASRRPAGGDFGSQTSVTRPAGRPGGESAPTLSDVALGGDGSAAVTWTTTIRDDDGYVAVVRAYTAFAPPGGPFGAKTRLSTAARPGYDARVAMDGSDDEAVVWGEAGFGVYARYRPAGGALGPPMRLAPPGLRGSFDATMRADGLATAAWQQNDGERNEFVVRDFGESGPTAPAQVMRSIPAYRRFPHARARCHPPGTRTLLETRHARVYSDLRKSYSTDSTSHYHPKYGCFFGRGKPVALEYGFGDFTLTAKNPPAMALAGPLVAYLFFDEECGTCGGRTGISVRDLRTGHPANGFGPEGDPYPGFDYGRIRKMVLRRDTALAYIECGACRAAHVFKIDSGAPGPVLVAKGKGIDPHFLRLRHGRVQWRARGRLRSAPLR